MKTTWELLCHRKHSKVAVALRTAGRRKAGRITRLAQIRFWLSVLTVFMVMSSPSQVQAAEILVPIATFTGMLDSVAFEVPAELAGGDASDPPVQVETGPITLSLDASGTNLFGLDDSTGTGSIDVTLLLDFPLLAALGEPQPSIQIIEAGAVMVTGGAGSHDFVFEASLTGGGMITSGLLTGVTFSNVNAYLGEGINSSWFPVTPPDITWSLGSSGEVTFPPELGGATVTGIDGNGALTLVPEPAAVTLFVLGVLGLVGYRRIARRTVARR